MTNAGSMTNNATGTFAVAAGASFNDNSGNYLTNYGDMTNAGTWTDNTGIINEFGSSFTNSGTMYNNEGMLTYGGSISDSGTMYSYMLDICESGSTEGILTIASGGTIYNTCDTEVVNGSVIINSGGEWYNTTGSSIYCWPNGNITNNGLLMNAGLLQNKGTITSSNEIYNSSSGTIDNTSQGSITINGGAVWNVGTINNSNIYTVAAGGTHNDYMGTFTGNIVDHGTIGLYNTGSSYTCTSNISGDGMVFSYASGAGTSVIELAGDNSTFTGTFCSYYGTLAADSTYAFGDDSANLENAGGNIDLNGISCSVVSVNMDGGTFTSSVGVPTLTITGYGWESPGSVFESGRFPAECRWWSTAVPTACGSRTPVPRIAARPRSPRGRWISPMGRRSIR